jgi:CBS domain-containing protein
VVIVDGRKVGILTDRDLALAFGEEGVSPDANAASVMSRDVKTIHQDAGVFTATAYLRDYQVRRLPIVDHDGSQQGRRQSFCTVSPSAQMDFPSGSFPA